MVSYTVTAKFTGPDLSARFVSWLASGHVGDVRRAGAVSGQVVVQDRVPGEPPVVSVRYLFADRAALDAYLADHAPRLRAQGLGQFGPEQGVVFERSTGLVAHAEPGR